MEILPSAFDVISKLVETRSGIVLNEDKAYLVKFRLKPLLRKVKLESFDALVGRLVSTEHSELHDQVVDALTTNETSFFRDLAPFNALRKVVLPALLEAKKSAKAIRIWCAACSTGQEPYSIAMMINEHFPAIHDWDIRILATDISHESLEIARRGYYSTFDIYRGLPEEYLKYTDKLENGYRVHPEIRDAVQFEYLNLIDDWDSMPVMDVIFLRNVLFYFSSEIKRRVIEKVERVLHHDGYLFLGQSETLVHLNSRFECQITEGASCFRWL